MSGFASNIEVGRLGRYLLFSVVIFRRVVYFLLTTEIQSRLKKFINLIYTFFFIFVRYIRDSPFFHTRRHQFRLARNNRYMYAGRTTIFQNFFFIFKQAKFFKDRIIVYTPDYAASCTRRQTSSTFFIM